MIKKAGGQGVVSGRKEDVHNASKLILPGVGAFDHGMRCLHQSGLVDLLKERASRGIPIMGICLGMQLLGEGSEEGKMSGLELLPISFKRFKFDKEIELRVPHVGWNVIDVVKDNPLISKDGDEKRFYFVHSYHAVCEKDSDTLAICEYGYSFPAACSRNNIFGFQFHPEKSHRFGLDLFKNFVRL
jgi:glutamine amidotransferase